MPSFEGQFLSIVFTGKQNPRILNHDFLLNNGVLPKNKEPFKGLFAKQDSDPFTDFLSTPVLACIRYAPINLLVEENRYQIRDDRFEDPPSSPIIEITRKYFGELLRFTPLQLGGINLNGIIKFVDVSDEQAFDERLGLTRKNLSDTVGSTDVRIGVSFSFPWNKGMVDVHLFRPKDRSQPGTISFNYEFNYQDIDSFLKNLDDSDQVYKKFIDLLQSLGVKGVSR